MGFRSVLPALLLGLLAPCRAWCDPAPTPNARAALINPVPSPADSQNTAAYSGSIAAAYREHAPLAWFSLGSLAIGGVFYAIGHGGDGSQVTNGQADRSRLTNAVSVAGISALLAAGSYFYYVHRAKARAEADGEWDAAVIGSPDGAGGIALGARLTVALPGLR
jgi:hypothetical protein